MTSFVTTLIPGSLLCLSCCREPGIEVAFVSVNNATCNYKFIIIIIYDNLSLIKRMGTKREIKLNKEIWLPLMVSSHLPTLHWVCEKCFLASHNGTYKRMNKWHLWILPWYSRSIYFSNVASSTSYLITRNICDFLSRNIARNQVTTFSRTTAPPSRVWMLQVM